MEGGWWIGSPQCLLLLAGRVDLLQQTSSSSWLDFLIGETF